MVSADAGASFQPARTQPPKPLVVIDHLPPTAADTATPVAGLDTAGVLWRFTRGVWISAGPANGVPEAFTAVDEDSYLAVFDTEVYRSDNGGTSWELLSATGR